jgi:hypothetical protein
LSLILAAAAGVFVAGVGFAAGVAAGAGVFGAGVGFAEAAGVGFAAGAVAGLAVVAGAGVFCALLVIGSSRLVNSRGAISLCFMIEYEN